MKNKIRLEGGPSHNAVIPDTGADFHKMPIGNEVDLDGKPIPGTECGYSIYVPNEDRTISFWIKNIWDSDSLVPQY